MNDGFDMPQAEIDHIRNGAKPQPVEPPSWEWAIVEIFGHRRHAGRAREEERFGAKMLRIDVPIKGDPAANGWETHWYGGSSIFSYTLTDEASALKINKPYEKAQAYLPFRDETPDDDPGDYGDTEEEGHHGI